MVGMCVQIRFEDVDLNGVDNSEKMRVVGDGVECCGVV
jgi:hypothetical protein